MQTANIVFMLVVLFYVIVVFSIRAGKAAATNGQRAFVIFELIPVAAAIMVSRDLVKCLLSGWVFL